MSERVVSPRLYVAIWAALVVLTLLTTAIAYRDLGVFNSVVALTIAVCKATLVVLFFMHVYYRTRLTWVFIAACIIWLALLIGFSLTDVLTRGWIAVPLPWTAGPPPPAG
jgi:cytochrome c oxidase subunit 4